MVDLRFGHIEGYPPGSVFRSRADLALAKVHIPLMHGISGRADTGASSIVASGGYEDDYDDGGETLLYTGEGGRDPESGRQVRHQTLTRGNLAMVKSFLDGLPVRVITGSIKLGYTYQGLYTIVSWDKVSGKSGFDVFQFKMVKLSESETVITPELEIRTEKVADRKEITIQRIVRDNFVSLTVKKLYDYTCQVCRVRLETPGGPYAEGAHIRPLGKPHLGSDDIHNLICLCPNHHVLYDNFCFSFRSDGSLLGLDGALMIHESHNLRASDIEYHVVQWASYQGASQ